MENIGTAEAIKPNQGNITRFKKRGGRLIISTQTPEGGENLQRLALDLSDRGRSVYFEQEGNSTIITIEPIVIL